jgi:hypothetical protein
MTTIDRHTITALVAHYKNCDDQTRGILLTDCKVHAMMHTDPHKRKIAAALYPELMRVENELSAPKRNAEREKPVVAPAQIRTTTAPIVRPILLIFGVGSGLFIAGAAVVGIAESVRAFLSVYGAWIVPAAIVLALLSAFVSGGAKQRGGRVQYPGWSEPTGGQNIHINISRDGGVHVNQQ